MKRATDSLGRTIMIAVIAGILFAGFLALTPRLTAGSESEPVGPAAVVPEVTSTTAAAVPAAMVELPVVTVPAAAFDGVEQEPMSEEPPAPIAEEPEEWTEDDWSNHPADDGTLALHIALFGPDEGKESVILRDFDQARFQVTLENTSDQHLWGVFAYLEGYGPVDCLPTQLGAGESAECSVFDTVYSGADTAAVWAHAWTSDHQVGVVTMHEYIVGS